MKQPTRNERKKQTKQICHCTCFKTKKQIETNKGTYITACRFYVIIKNKFQCEKKFISTVNTEGTPYIYVRWYKINVNV